MKRSKEFGRLRLFFEGGGGTSAAKSIAEPPMEVKNEPQMTDQTTNLDLNVEDWPLEDRFKVVSEFLDSMPCSPRAFKPKRETLSRKSIYRARLEKSEAINRKLTHKVAELENALERVIAQVQAMSAATALHQQELVVFEIATVTISNDTKLESVIPPARYMGVDPISLDTTTSGIDDTLPIYHAGDNGLLEGNPCASDTKDELITSPPSFLSMRRERVPSTPDSCSATNCRTRILSAIAVLEAETASTPDHFGDQLSTTPRNSVCNPYFPKFPFTKSLISTPQLLPRLLKESINPRSANRGLKDFIPIDPSIFTRSLPGGSSKARPAGHRRSRPPRTSCKHSCQEVLLRQYDGRRVAVHHVQPFYYHCHTD